MSKVFSLETARDQLKFDATSGRLISLKFKSRPRRELVFSRPDDPTFVLQYFSPMREYRMLTSHDAETTTISVSDVRGRRRLVMDFGKLGGLDVHVRAEVESAADWECSYWRIAVNNKAGLEIVDVQFPIVVARCPMTGEPGTGTVVLPQYMGQVLHNPSPQTIPEDKPQAWQLSKTWPSTFHYPGSVFAQFLAYYRNGLGVYVACDDTQGHMKLFRALRRGRGLRLGVAHVGDWPTHGRRKLPYAVRIRSFAGDWYDAAEIYRSWALKQKWARPLHKRQDVPQWLLDSPPHITVRLQGYVDDGPVFPVKEFLPYEKCIPLLGKIAERVGAPLVAVLMSWEHGGPWVYPECFPPVGGEASLMHFVKMARQRGWRVGSFCNGTRWVMAHRWNGYDGREFFFQHGGERSVCRLPNGERWPGDWDGSWRPSYICCLGSKITRQIAVDFVRRLLVWSMQSIQFFDQNINATSFPCFAGDHGHPPMPGKWMAAEMERIIHEFRQEAIRRGETEVIQSVEMPCNEYCLPLFQQCDVRGQPPDGDTESFIPLYHYLYHECIVMHGMMSVGYEPYALPMRNAYNCVIGEIPGAVMTGDGTLLNRETFNWAEWEPKIGSNEDALEMIRTVTAMRRGPGRDFLVYGRMMRPAKVDGIDRIEWEYAGRRRQVDAVFHAAWQAPDGRVGIVFANWTKEDRKVSFSDRRLAEKTTVHTCGREMSAETVSTAQPLTVTVPGLGVVVVEGALAR
ncbi:MAG: DUF6259 domain-containing protein [Armatimonadetes bacterium]|nr:DUF6259 domain-containing protein [Armatimonadota bacterium]